MSISTLKEKIQLLEAVFGEGVHSNSGKNITVKCYNCGNKKSINKKKLSICLETGRFHCWVCEAKGRNIASAVKNCTNDKNLLTKINQVFEYINNKNAEDKQEKVIKLPDDFELLCLSKRRTSNFAKKYLYGRGIDEKTMWKYKIGISNHSEYMNRIIFPSFDSELNLNFFQTRLCDENAKIPYRNCDGNKKEIIFNENLIDWRQPVVLVEGVFDAMKLNLNTCCLLGSWIDESYLIFQKIVKHKTPVILALDTDAIEKTIKIAKNLKSYCIDVKIVQKSKFDVGDMNYLEAKKYILGAEQFDNTNRLRYLINDIKSGSIF